MSEINSEYQVTIIIIIVRIMVKLAPCPSHVGSIAHSFDRIYWRLFKVDNVK